MTTDPSELHLLVHTIGSSILIWDLSQAGFSRHVIYREPPVQVLVGAVPGPGLHSHHGSSRTFRSPIGGHRNMLATAMLSIAQSSRARAGSTATTPHVTEKRRPWQESLYTEFLPPRGELIVHLASSGLMALVFSGSGEIAWRGWPENYSVYKKHSGIFVGDIGNYVMTSHDCDALLWKIQANQAGQIGTFAGHRAEILKACFDVGERRLVSVDKDGIACCWSTDTLHQLLSVKLQSPAASVWQSWSPHCAHGRRQHIIGRSNELLESEGIEVGDACTINPTPSGSQTGDSADAAALEAVDVAFTSDDCDILFVGSSGELLCVDSVSGATMWAVPAHMRTLQQSHVSASPSTMHVVEVVLVDSDGLAVRWVGPHRYEQLKLKVPRICSKRFGELSSSSGHHRQQADVASVTAQLASCGQSELLQMLCSNAGQKLALECSSSTAKSPAASAWSKIRDVYMHGPCVTVSAMHLLPVCSSSSRRIGILVGMSDGQIRLSHLQVKVDECPALRTLSVPHGDTGPVTCIQGRPFNPTAAAVYANGSVMLWDILPKGSSEGHVIVGSDQASHGRKPLPCYSWAAWSEDGQILVVSGSSGTVIWHSNGTSVKLSDSISMSGAIHGCGISCTFLIVQSATSLSLWSATGGRQLCQLDNVDSISGSSILHDCVAVGPENGCCAAVPLLNMSIGLFAIRQSCILLIATCKGHHRRVTALSFTAHTSVLASGGALQRDFVVLSRIHSLLWTLTEDKQWMIVDDGGNVFLWCAVTGMPLHAMHICGTAVLSLRFGKSDLWMSIASADHVHFVWRDHPLGEDILAIWLDRSRSVDSCVHITRALLAVYPNLVNLKDKHGISLLSYASGISSERANKLLDVILDISPRHWAGLVCCTSGTGNSQCDHDWELPVTDADRNRVGFVGQRSRVTPMPVAHNWCGLLRVGDLLERQRSSYGAPVWDWEQTCGLHKKRVWNALELALLADFPSKIQAVLRGVVSDVFTVPSGIGVMPVIAILASKYPKIAALLIPDAPMHAISCFYLPDLTEQDLDPLIATTHAQMTPRDTKAMWVQEHSGPRPLSEKRQTLEVQASVCMWPHVATMGAGGLLHIIVKNNLDISLYRSSVVQGLIMHKWYAHARQHLLKDIFLFAVLMALFIVDLSMIGNTMGRSLLSDTPGVSQQSVATADSLLDTSAYGIACTAQELLMLIICFRNLWLMKKRMHLTSFLKWLLKGWNSMDMASHLVLVIVLACRLSSLHTHNTKFYISAAASCAVFLWSKMLFFMMPFSTTGPLIRMIIEITKDMIPFLGVLMIMTIGFSGAFYILFTPEVGGPMASEDIPSGFADFQSTLLSTFLMILGSFDISTFMEATPHSEMAIAMFCLYQVLGMIVLLNLLIAIMGDTFDRVRETESLHFWKGRAAVIDEIELAQQLGHGAGATATVGSKYLAPYLHTISGTELTQLQKKQWGGKLRETKDQIAKLEQSLTTRLQAIEKELHRRNSQVPDMYPAAYPSHPMHLNRPHGTRKPYQADIRAGAHALV
eukprot:jgi/Ulvmu1/5212/UM022_0005.1